MISGEKVSRGSMGKLDLCIAHILQFGVFINMPKYRAKSVIALITDITDSLQFGELGGASIIYTIQYIHHDMVCGIGVILPGHINFASNGSALSTFF